MNVGRKLMFIVISSVALVTLPAAGGIYYLAKQKLLASEAVTLVAETKILLTNNAMRLSEAEPSLKSLSRMLSKSLAKQPQAGEDLAFYQLVQRNDDRAWRSRGAADGWCFPKLARASSARRCVGSRTGVSSSLPLGHQAER